MAEKLDINVLIDFSETLARDLGTPLSMNIHEAKTRPSDFKILKNLAKGGYGEVYVVERQGRIYAMKKVSKSLVMKNPNTTFFMNEKEIMTSHSIDWLVRSYMCVQDGTHIYYIMDFIHGGDLMGYLSKIDIMKENEIRFYGAEIFTAVHEMHKMGWVHRDLKPDNILIDKLGHVKLADFGSCVKLVNGRVQSNTTVGTPDYISPDVLSSVGETVVYGPEVDFWTIGVILYEMFYGTTPFYSESLKQTYSKINSIDFKCEEGVSEDLKDLIEHLLCTKDRRYGYNEVKQHKFFLGMDWDALRQMEAPFKPSLSSEEDISNFVDTEFEPDTCSTECGFRNFIGFTYDPEHCAKILDGISVGIDRPCRACLGDGRTSAAELDVEERAMALDKDIVWRTRELEDLRHLVASLTKEKDEKQALADTYSMDLQRTIDQIVCKKEALGQLQTSIHIAKEELGLIKNDISEKMKCIGVTHPLQSGNSVSGVGYEVMEGLRDVKKLIERFRFAEMLDSVQQNAYWFYKQNQYLLNEVRILSQHENDNKGVEDLKKQLRIQKSEIREYEQKIDQEIVIRKKLEEEIKILKRSLKEASRAVGNFVLPCVNAANNRETEMVVEDCTLKIDGYEAILSNLYVRELKNNELHHLPYRKRALCLQLHFLSNVVRCSSSSGTRRSLKALEIDMDKECKILRGLEDLLKILTGKTREEAEMQRRGSLKKIGQLKEEIERAKKSTISEHASGSVIDDNEKVYEFNNHLFYEKTVAKGTLCDHCNEVLYGIVNQAFCCKDCLLVVHKSCYILVETSCELSRAINGGTSLAIICRTNEDKEKLLKLNKAI